MGREHGYITISDDGVVTAYRQVDPVTPISLTGGGGGPASLPDWWAVDSTPGSESVEFAGAVEIEPSGDVSALVLRKALGSGQTEHLIRAYNEDGDLALDLDAQGILDVLHIVVQEPPDTGADSAPDRTAVLPGSVLVTGDTDAPGSDAQLLGATRFWEDLNEPDGFGGFVSKSTAVFRVNKAGAIVSINPRYGAAPYPTDVGIEFVGPPDATGNAIELWDYPFNETLFSLSYAGEVAIAPSTADVVLLDLQPNAATSLGTPVMRWHNASGAVVAHVDEDGGFGFSSDGITGSEIGQLVVNVDDSIFSTGQLFSVALEGRTYFSLDGIKAGDDPLGTLYGAIFTSGHAEQRLFSVWAFTAQTGNLFEAHDENGNTDPEFRINGAGIPVIAVNAAPADGDLIAGECALWFDSTDGAAKLMLKAKQANGTVKTGSVNVTT